MIYRLMKNDTPTVIDPILLARLNKSISGVLDFNKLDRLCDLANFDGQEIHYLMSFLYDEENRCCIEGKAKVAVKLECQRCLKLFSYKIDTTFRLYPVTASAEKDFPKQLDMVVMENGLVSVPDIVEDELILSLPEVPKHADDDPNCQQLPAACLLENGKQQVNPFTVLRNVGKTDGKK